MVGNEDNIGLAAFPSPARANSPGLIEWTMKAVSRNYCRHQSKARGVTGGTVVWKVTCKVFHASASYAEVHRNAKGPWLHRKKLFSSLKLFLFNYESKQQLHTAVLLSVWFRYIQMSLALAFRFRNPGSLFFFFKTLFIRLDADSCYLMQNKAHTWWFTCEAVNKNGDFINCI